MRTLESHRPRRDRALVRPRLGVALALAVLLAAQLSCATTGGPPPPPSQPVARQALAPQLRLFYDALTDYGDWVLIEPYGYVFRPAINDPNWRPYEEGFWVPSDSYGWVWISSEPFGWATYHYGTWFNDRFQGWVWLPAADWGPAWVAWEQSNDYVGWAPASWNAGQLVPTGPYVYAPIAQLGTTQVRTMIVTKEQLGAQAEDLRPADNVVEHEGVAMPHGPSFQSIERRVGPLTRAKFEDVMPQAPLTGAGRTSGRGGAAPAPTVETTKRAGEEIARQARTWAEQPARAPALVPVLRLGPRRPAGAGRPAARGRAHADSAAVDSTH